MPDRLLSLQEAAPLLKFKNVVALRAWLRRKLIPVVVRGPRSRFIRESDIQKFIKNSTVPAAAGANG